MTINQITRAALMGGLGAAMALGCLTAPGTASAQSMWDNPSGQMGALAPENIEQHKGEPPTDFTGTWMISGQWQFLPRPKFKEEAQRVVDAQAAAAAEGKAADQYIGQCWPPGMPVMMTRVWPVNIVQIETSMVMISNFLTQVRWVFLDGREFSDPDLYVPSYNGESIGHWDGDELVIESQGFATKAHSVDGVPISEEFKIVERVRLINDGETLEIDYTMTDPVNWEGEWKSVKRWNRLHKTDFLETHCLPDTNEGIPGLGDAYQVETR